MLFTHHLLVAVTNFANHPYLFMLLSILTSASACDSKHVEAWCGALRGQIIIVYGFASLWKLTPKRLDGTIVRGILTSFEEQGVAHGIASAPPGHWLQWMCLLFHGFTSFTMSQRIGYTFPLAMILSITLFAGKDHQQQSASASASRLRKPPYYPPLSRRLLVGIWIALQVLIPLRMPFVSRNEYAYTAEGYRFSWTMMLHSKSIFMTPNQFTGELRPTCNYAEWPTIERIPYHHLIGVRGMAALSIFPRILPKLARNVGDILDNSYPSMLRMHADWFASVDGGPYVRLVDPTIGEEQGSSAR